MAQNFLDGSSSVLARDGSVQEAPSPFENIATHGLDELTRRLGWPGQRSDMPSFDVRKAQVQDILSVFDSKGPLPEEYRADFFASLTDITLNAQQCYVHHDLEETLANLAMSDDAVYKALREAVTPGRCALAYVGKLRNRAQVTIDKLDEFVRHGPYDHDPVQADVVWCGEQLRSIVRQTSDCLNSRAPLPPDVLSKAASFLAELLQHVCTRNYDVYEDIEWDSSD